MQTIHNVIRKSVAPMFIACCLLGLAAQNSRADESFAEPRARLKNTTSSRRFGEVGESTPNTAPRTPQTTSTDEPKNEQNSIVRVSSLPRDNIAVLNVILDASDSSGFADAISTWLELELQQHVSLGYIAITNFQSLIDMSPFDVLKKQFNSLPPPAETEAAAKARYGTNGPQELYTNGELSSFYKQQIPDFNKENFLRKFHNLPRYTALQRLREKGFQYRKAIDSQQIAKRFSANNYPLWIVRAGSVDYVFDSSRAPSALFDNFGKFSAPRSAGNLARSTNVYTANAVSFEPFDPNIAVVNQSPLPTLFGTNKSASAATSSTVLFVRKKQPTQYSACMNSRTVQIPLGPSAQNLDLDTLYYNDQDSQQRRKAANHAGHKIPVQLNSYQDPQTAQIGVYCLPARVSRRTIGSEHVLEYKEGNAAW